MATEAHLIPFTDLGGTGPVLHFAHANGYPFGTYSRLLSSLTPHLRVIGMAHRPLWPGTLEVGVESWWVLADDLIRFLETRATGPVIGAGHSLGATITFFAAIQRPDLFSHLILIEPVFLPRRIYLLLHIIPFPLRKWFIPPAKVSAQRRNFWETREEAFTDFRSKRAFAKISDEVLRDYVLYGTREKPEGGFTLAWSREWETHIYLHLDSPWKSFPKLELPTLMLRGATSNTVFPDAWRDLQQTVPGAAFLEVPDTGHLLPFEQPHTVEEAIRAFLGQSGQEFANFTLPSS